MPEMSNLDNILTIYRHSIECHPLFVLRTLVEHYGLTCSDDRRSLIDALVEHFRKQLEGETK